MSLWDLIGCAWHNLWVRKLRTGLNLIGIVISCLLLLSTMAAAKGIQLAIERFVQNSPEALRFRIVPTYDASAQPPEAALAIDASMSEDRKLRMRSMLLRQWKQTNLPRPSVIDFERLEQLLSIEHIRDISPEMQFNCVFQLEGQEQSAMIRGTSNLDVELASRVVMGETLAQAGGEGLLLHEALAFEMGLRSDAELASLLGKSISVQFRQTRDPFQIFASDLARLSPADQGLLLDSIESLVAGNSLQSLDAEAIGVLQRLLQMRASRQQKEKELPKGQAITKEFRIAGIFRDRDQEDESTILSRFFGGSEQLVVHHAQLRPVSEALGNSGFSNGVVYVDEVRNLESVTEQLKAASIASISATSTIERLYQSIDRSKFSLLCVASVILLVAAVGISNTMITSVVERSEEIGILKAVGASNRQVTSIVLLECMMTGALGGLLAVGLTYLLAGLGNGVLRNYVEQRGNLNLEGAVIVVDGWMIFGTLALAVTISALAGLWPAIKAARLDPIVAMGRL